MLSKLCIVLCTIIRYNLESTDCWIRSTKAFLFSLFKLGVEGTLASKLCRLSSAQNFSLVILSEIQERGKTSSLPLEHKQCNCPGVLGPVVEKVIR